MSARRLQDLAREPMAGGNGLPVTGDVSRCNRRLAALGTDQSSENWRLGPSDVNERRFWKQHRKACEACIQATSTDHSPWPVVPADDKKNARLIVSEILLEALRKLKMAYPKTIPVRRRELAAIRARLSGRETHGVRG